MRVEYWHETVECVSYRIYTRDGDRMPVGLVNDYRVSGGRLAAHLAVGDDVDVSACRTVHAAARQVVTEPMVRRGMARMEVSQ